MNEISIKSKILAILAKFADFADCVKNIFLTLRVTTQVTVTENLL